MRKILSLILSVVLIASPLFAKYEDGSNDASSAVLYGKTSSGSIVPIAVDSLGTVSTGAASDPSVVFNVKTEYGAKGDGITLFDGNITSGDATFTSATASFTSADIGKVITIIGAGGATIDLTTTILSINSATSVELATNASATVVDVNYTYGTDDTAAIQSAITAVGTTTNKFAQIFFPAGIYIVNGTFTAANNSQLGLPTVSRASGAAAPIYTIFFKGSAVNTNQTAGNFYGLGGSIIYSTRYGTNGTYSILSGIATHASNPGNCTQVKVVIEDLTFRTVQNPTNSAINLGTTLTAYMKNVLVDTAGISNTDMPQPTTSGTYGIIAPTNLNGATTLFENIKTRGFYNGIQLSEHGNLSKSLHFYHVNAIVINGLSTSHSKYLSHVTVERCQKVLNFIGGPSYVNIQGLEIEHNGTDGPAWAATTLDIEDSNNYGMGTVQYTIVNIDGTDQITVNGGSNLSLIGTGMNGNSDLNIFGNNANVGIGLGTTTPVTKFQVGTSDTTVYSGTALSTAAIGVSNRNTTVNNMSQLNFLTGTSTGTITSVVRTGAVNTSHTLGSESGDYFINTKNAGTLSNKFYIKADGNVGIGSTAPGVKFDVQGTIRASSGTAGQATCWKADKSLGQCTSVVGAGGACTCS